MDYPAPSVNPRPVIPDNIVRAICIQDAQQIWLAFDNGISQITFDPSITLLGKRSQIGKLKNATLFNDTLYIQTNIGYFKRTLDAGDHFEPVDIKKETFHLCHRTVCTTRSVSAMYSTTPNHWESLPMRNRSILSAITPIGFVPKTKPACSITITGKGH